VGWASRILGRARRLLLPGWDEQQKALKQVLGQAVKVSQQVEKSGRHRAESESNLRERLGALADLVRAEAKQRERVDRRVGKLRRDLRSHAKASERLLGRAGRAWSQVSEQQRIFRRLDRLQASTLPIVVGPWTGEVGFELLYWIPFLQWALATRGIDPGRVIAVSRGGAELWYSNVAGRYLDLLDVVSADEFRQWTETSKKQRDLRRFDIDALRRIRRRIGLPRLHLLHPLLMYRLFLPTWRREPAVSDVESFTQYRLFSPSRDASRQSTLPSRYVAVKIYFSLSFPPTEENRAFAIQLVRRVAERVPVVVLTSGVKLDDHDEWRAEEQGRIVTIDHLLTPTRNLDVQTRVLAGAEAFVGTYGGFSYLAPFLGVPSISFFSRSDTFYPHHLDLAERVFRRLGGGRFLALDTRDFDMFERVLGQSPDVAHRKNTIV